MHGSGEVGCGCGVALCPTQLHSCGTHALCAYSLLTPVSSPCLLQLEEIRSQLDERGGTNTNASPLIRTKQAMRTLEREVRHAICG